MKMLSSVEMDDFKTDKKKKETKSTAPPETVSRFLFSFFFSFVVLNEALSPPLAGYERVTAVRGQLPQNIEYPRGNGTRRP